MEKNKNVIIAVLLMMAVWFFFNSKQPPVPPVEEAAPVASAVVPSPAQPAASDMASSTASDQAAPETRVTVTSPLYEAVFNSIGARLTTMQLNNYRQSAGEDDSAVQVVSAPSPRLGTLALQGTSGLLLSSEAAYALVDSPKQKRLAAGESTDVVFRAVTAGLVVDRIYTLHGDSYVIDVQTRIRNTGPSPISGALELSLLQQWDDSVKSDMVVFNGVYTLVDGSLQEVTVKDLKDESPSYGAGTTWTSFQTKYFMSALIPGEAAVEKVRIQRDGDLIRNIVSTPAVTLAPGAEHSFSDQGYFGPRDEKVLESVGHQLDEAISFGIFTPIAVPLLKTLKFFYAYIGNYGVAIILLTVIIKLIFWPLTHKSYASMKSMQKLQPEMAKLKERFKNDRQRQGQEMMELYKKHRVNPMGGCLPMVVQIPVFFALYRVLYQAIELRHAPFVFWITDLADKDPYYITPLIMGVTMFVQQKLTPSTADPAQQKIFLLMPVIFTALFLNFPAGLVVYWLINNLLTIAQQVYIHRTMS